MALVLGYWISFLCIGLAYLWAGPAFGQSNVGTATTTGASRSLNPAISVNVLMRGTALRNPLTLKEEDHGEEGENGDHGEEEEENGDHEEEEEGHGHGEESQKSGFDLQEIELRFTAFADPYVKGDLTLAMHGASGIEVEEGYVVAQTLPRGLGLRAGKLFLPFGKQNRLHTHQFPFVEVPLVNREFLGPVGLNDIGVEVSYLLPLPWFSEIRVGAFEGSEEGPFRSEKGEDLAYLGRWGHLWDLGSSTTLGLGGSYAGGRNGVGSDGLAQFVGGDLTIKWIPLRRAQYRGVTFQAEYLWSKVDEDEFSAPTQGGLVSHLQVRMSRRWWLGGRLDALGLPKELEDDPDQRRASVLLALVPSEFSALRFQYSAHQVEDQETQHLFQVQFNFTIGSHPAHAY